MFRQPCPSCARKDAALREQRESTNVMGKAAVALGVKVQILQRALDEIEAGCVAMQADVMLRPTAHDILAICDSSRAALAEAAPAAGEELERLAAIQHDIWSHWMRWFFENDTPENRERWKRQMKTPYAELSEREKESDRKVVREFCLSPAPPAAPEHCNCPEHRHNWLRDPAPEPQREEE